MNGEEVQNRWLEKNAEVISTRLKKVVDRITTKIEKALNKGRHNIYLGETLPLWWSRLAHDEKEIVEQYLRNLGFITGTTYISGIGHGGSLTVSWKPKDFQQRFKIVEVNDRLRHVLETGHAPQVTIE